MAEFVSNEDNIELYRLALAASFNETLIIPVSQITIFDARDIPNVRTFDFTAEFQNRRLLRQLQASSGGILIYVAVDQLVNEDIGFSDAADRCETAVKAFNVEVFNNVLQSAFGSDVDYQRTFCAIDYQRTLPPSTRPTVATHLPSLVPSLAPTESDVTAALAVTSVTSGLSVLPYVVSIGGCCMLSCCVSVCFWFCINKLNRKKEQSDTDSEPRNALGNEKE